MQQQLMIKRIARGEYVAVNTLPVVRFSRKKHDEWRVAWGEAELKVSSKSEGIDAVLNIAELAHIEHRHPLRITR